MDLRKGVIGPEKGGNIREGRVWFLLVFFKEGRGVFLGVMWKGERG